MPPRPEGELGPGGPIPAPSIEQFADAVDRGDRSTRPLHQAGKRHGIERAGFWEVFHFAVLLDLIASGRDLRRLTGPSGLSAGRLLAHRVPSLGRVPSSRPHHNTWPDHPETGD